MSTDSFNPYHEWLGLDRQVTQPDHYQLLGVDRGERDPARIAEAAHRALARLHACRPGARGAEWAQLLEQISASAACLGDPLQRAAYDQRLRQTAAGGRVYSRPAPRNRAAFGAASATLPMPGSQAAPTAVPAGRGGPMTNVPMTNVPMTNVPMTNVPMTNVPMTNVPMTNVPMTNVPMTNVPVATEPAYGSLMNHGYGGLPVAQRGLSTGVSGDGLPAMAMPARIPVAAQPVAASACVERPARAGRSTASRVRGRVQTSSLVLRVGGVAGALVILAGAIVVAALSKQAHAPNRPASARSIAQASPGDASRIARPSNRQSDTPRRSAAANRPTRDRRGEPTHAWRRAPGVVDSASTADAEPGRGASVDRDPSSETPGLIDAKEPPSHVDATVSSGDDSPPDLAARADGQTPAVDDANPSSASGNRLGATDPLTMPAFPTGPTLERLELAQTLGTSAAGASPAASGGAAPVESATARLPASNPAPPNGDSESSVSTSMGAGAMGAGAPDGRPAGAVGADPADAGPQRSAVPEMRAAPEAAATLARALTAARAAIQDHRYDAALAELNKLQTLPKQPADHARYERLVLLAGYAKNFDLALRSAIDGLHSGDEIEIGGSAFVGFVEASADSLTLHVKGANRTYRLDSLPPGLAVALADRWLNKDDPVSLAVKGAYLATLKDSTQTQRAKAREWLEEASRRGVEGELHKVLDDTYDERETGA